MIDGGYGGDVLKFDGTLYKVTECFSHDYKKLDDIHPSDCQSVGSSTAQPPRDDVQVSNPVLSPAPQTAVTSSDQQSEPNRESAVRALLAQWVSSFKTKDLQQQVSCYASELEIYYRKRNAPQSFVANNKAHAFGAIATIRHFDLTDINISFLDPADAIVTFTKSWDTILASGKPYAGSEIQRLKLTLMDGEWRIRSEEELQVLWVRH